MTSPHYDAADLETLRRWDTPTICNAMELVMPARRGGGFSIKPFVVSDVTLPPICGVARTGRLRAAQPSGRSRDDDRAARIGWYDYVAKANLPTIVMLEDLDEPAGIGAFWGEVNTAVHKGLGALGCVTSGSIRDLDQVAPGFQLLAGMINPSHAYVHIVDFGGPVTIHGMPVSHDEVIHADRHGAVVIPPEAVRQIPAAVDLMIRKEAVILDMARAPGFNVEKLREALRISDDIH